VAHEQQTMSSAPGRFGAGALWHLQVPIGAILAVVGAAMVVLAFSGLLGAGRLILECALGAAVFVSGALLVGAAVVGKRSTGLHLAAGELALAASIVYLGEAMPPFHHGAVDHDAGLAQFVAVMVGLVVGATSLALPAPASSEKATGVHWASVIRDSVILIVSTIVVAIGISQTANPAVMPPKWNWTSFLGITIPGMLTLIFLRGGLKAIGRRGQLARGVTVERLLVVGLGVMVFGSVTNLNLGASGFQAGLKGNSGGLTLWIAAALFFVVVRGAFKLAIPDGDAPMSRWRARSSTSSVPSGSSTASGRSSWAAADRSGWRRLCGRRRDHRQRHGRVDLRAPSSQGHGARRRRVRRSPARRRRALDACAHRRVTLAGEPGHRRLPPGWMKPRQSPTQHRRSSILPSCDGYEPARSAGAA